MAFCFNINFYINRKKSINFNENKALYFVCMYIYFFFTDINYEIFTLGKDIFLNSGNCALVIPFDAGSINVGPNLMR